MKIINKYKALDDSIFNTEKECIKYEEILHEVNSILNNLPKIKDEDCKFTNGEGYIQHNPNIKKDLETDIVRLSNKYFKPKELFVKFNYYLGRVIDDSGMSCLNKLSYKLMCIDDKNREWGQPYFAINPDKGIQKQLN